MSEVTTIGLNIANDAFHAHGAEASVLALIITKVRRMKLLEFFFPQPRCLLALEACATSDHAVRRDK